MEDPELNLKKASELAGWLIKEKGVVKKTAYLIASRKYKIENWHLVQKYYNENIKTKQIELF